MKELTVIKGNVGVSISRIIVVAPLVAIMKYQAKAIWNNSSNNHRLGVGGRHGRSHGNVRLKNSRFFFSQNQ